MKSLVELQALAYQQKNEGKTDLVEFLVNLTPRAVADTAVSRKVVGKGARDNPERYSGWFLVHLFSNKFQRVVGEAMDVCLRGLKESNTSRFDSYSVKNKCIGYIPYYLSGLSRAQFL